MACHLLYHLLYQLLILILLLRQSRKEEDCKMYKFRGITKAILLISLFLWSTPAFSTTITVLDEDFDDVTNLSNPASVRTIKNILANNPSQLPLGTTWSAPGAANVNVRRADNAINTSSNTRGFDSFFTPADSQNRFLILGDNSKAIVKDDKPTTGTMGVIFPFVLPAGIHSMTVSYEYAFDGFDKINADDIMSVIISDGYSLPMLIQSITSPDNRSAGSIGNISSGIFEETFLIGELPPSSNLSLIFQLSENSSLKTNTAVGIDNVRVTVAAPEPSSFLLLGSGLLGLGLYGRKRLKK